MERRSFIRLCGIGTGAALASTLLLPGCAGIVHVHATPVDGVLRVPKSAFVVERKGATTMGRSIVVEGRGMQAPIVVFRKGEEEHLALLMQCTHKATELNVTGDQLSCPAHGSMFSSMGAVLEGPASEPLKRFLVTYSGEDLLIAIG